MIDTARLIDLSLEENIVPDKGFHYRWDEYARWQMDTLIACGMKPEHRLLDIGCGPLRLGTLAIPYLNDGCYAGIEPYTPYVRLGRKLIAQMGIEKSYQLIESASFEFALTGMSFEFGMAQSVFTHLSQDQIQLCMERAGEVFVEGGKLIFTYEDQKYRSGRLYGGTYPMVAGEMMAWDDLAKLGRDNGFQLERLEIAHPTQKVAQLVRLPR